MDEVERFVIDGNVSRFVDQLRAETDSFRRETLKRLLMAEINRFGSVADRLQTTERHLTDGQALIAQQRRLIAKMKSNGGDASTAERMLRTFESIQDLFQRVHAAVHEEMARRRPECHPASSWVEGTAPDEWIESSAPCASGGPFFPGHGRRPPAT